MFFEILFASIVLTNVYNIYAPSLKQKGNQNIEHIHSYKDNPAPLTKRMRSKIGVFVETAAMLITVPLFLTCKAVSVGMMRVERRMHKVK